MSLHKQKTNAMSSPANQDDVEMGQFLRDLWKDGKGRGSAQGSSSVAGPSSAGPSSASTLEPLSFEHDNIVNQSDKADLERYIRNLTSSADQYKALDNLMRFVTGGQFCVAAFFVAARAAIPAHASTTAWEALLALITFALISDFITIFSCFMHADLLLETIADVLDDKRRAFNMIRCAIDTLKQGNRIPVPIPAYISNLIPGCTNIYDNMRRAKFVAVHRLARKGWILFFTAIGILLLVVMIFFLAILTFHRTIWISILTYASAMAIASLMQQWDSSRGMDYSLLPR